MSPMGKLKFISEAIRNFGVGLMVGAFLLRIADRIDDLTLWWLMGFGIANVAFGVIIFPEETKNG